MKTNLHMPHGTACSFIAQAFRFAQAGVLLLTALAGSTQNPYKAPLYWNPYEYCYTTDGHIPESEWAANIDWMEQNLKPYGYNMICIDGWGDDSNYNRHGYRTTHSSNWTHNYAWWANKLKGRGMELGIYNNPLWIIRNAAEDGLLIKGTSIPISSLIDDSENSLWFTWVQVDRPGAEEYVKGYIQYYADMGVTYLRVDFLSWFEDGFDKNLGAVGVNRPHWEYETALRWMKEACDANEIFLSLVMPHLKNEAETEIQYGHMVRINEDVAHGQWDRFNNFDRGIRHSWWSQWYNTFDGYTYWSHVSGRNQVILDGDFIRLNTMANDDEKKTVISLHLMAGGPLSVADQYTTIGNDLWLYQNTEMLALNLDGFVGKPLFTNDPTDEASQVWAGQMSNGDWIVGFFNREDNTRNRSLDFSWLGFNGSATVRNLWAHQDLGVMSSYAVDVPPHGCVILKVIPTGHQGEMNIAGSFTGWTPNINMDLVNDTWEARAVFLNSGNHQLKFVNTTDWSGDDWGNASGLSGTASLTTGGGANISFTTGSSGPYDISFNDQMLNYSVEQSGIQSGAIYTVRSRHSGKVLEVSGNSTANGANVQQSDDFGNNNQKWVVTDVGNGQYSIVSVHSGKSLDVEANSTANGANIHQWEYFGNGNQKWQIESVGEGYYKIASVHSGKAIDIESGATNSGGNIHQWEYFGLNSQHWAFEYVSGGARTTPEFAAELSEEKNMPFGIYPNPLDDSEQLLITIAPDNDPQARLRIFTVSGQEVYSAAVTAPEMHIDKALLKPGIYLVWYALGVEKYTRKLIVK